MCAGQPCIVNRTCVSPVLIGIVFKTSGLTRCIVVGKGKEKASFQKAVLLNELQQRNV